MQTLFSQKQIQSQIQKLAESLNHDYQNKDVVVLCVLQGSLVFFSDMIRLLKFAFRCEFVKLSSYGDDTKSSGHITMDLDVKTSLKDKHVLIFEDIIDTGLTLKFLKNHLQNQSPLSIKTAVLLQRQHNQRTLKNLVDYSVFTIQDEFVVGYGLDYAGLHRGLPYIAVFKESF